MIQKVYYINLDRSTGRHYAQLATADLAEVPPSKLQRLRAKDGKDYQCNGDIIEDIMADGFPEFQCFLNSDTAWQPKNLAVNWSLLRAIRLVAEKKQTAIILEDDAVLRGKFSDIQHDFDVLDTDFDVAWFETWRWKSDTSDYRTLIKLEKRLTYTNIPYIHKNFHGLGSRARLFTPSGASQFLDLSLRTPRIGSELIGWSYAINGGDTSKFLLCRPAKAHMIGCHKFYQF